MRTIVLLSLGVVLIPATMAQAAGDIISIGFLSAFSFTSSGNGINDSGQVTGASGATWIGGFTNHACLYSGGQLYDLDTPFRAGSRGSAINSSGQVAGLSGGHA